MAVILFFIYFGENAMKNVAKLSLTLFTCAVLTACGSGGGNGGSSSSVNQAIEKGKAGVDAIINTAQGNDNVSGKVIILSGKDEKATAKWSDQTNASLDKIVVDGQEIPMHFSNFKGVINYNYQLVSLDSKGKKYQYFSAGLAEKDDSYFFVNGNPTTSMPASGTASYQGDSLVTGNNSKFEETDYLKGTSQFTADFGAKTLNGTLNVDTLEPIKVEAKIVNNGFAGSASSKEFHTTAEVQGKFYGANATELGGVFTDKSAVGDDKKWGGVFGAKK